jgi:WD40-like Beta Propeller Repeat
LRSDAWTLPKPSKSRLRSPKPARRCTIAGNLLSVAADGHAFRSIRSWIGATVAVSGLAAMPPCCGVFRPAAARAEYAQVTSFADSATSPALSPDGRFLTFIRGNSTFEGPGQIFMKRLPDGQPVQLTHDDAAKMSPVFSLDGSRIAYTSRSSEFVWDTWVIPLPGRTPRLWLANASGLTWTDDRHVLFSAITTGLHMNLVSATDQREAVRLVYDPDREDDPAEHLSHPASLRLPREIVCRVHQRRLTATISAPGI